MTLSLVVNLSDFKKVLSSLAKSGARASGSLVNFETTGEYVTLSLVSKEIHVDFKFKPIKIVAQGSFAIGFNLLVNAIKELKDGELSLGIEESAQNILSLKIACGRTKINLVAEKKENFEYLNGSSYTSEINLNIVDFLSAYKKVSSCVSNQIDRPALAGVLFHGETTESNSKCVLVGTDGRKLAVSKYSCEAGFAMDKEFLIPKKTLDQISDIHAVTNIDSCTFAYGDKDAIVSFGNMIYVKFSFIDSKFPNYKAIMLPETEKFIDIKTKDILPVLKRLFSIDGSSALNLSTNLVIEKDSLVFKVQSASNYVEDEVECKTFGFEEQSTAISMHLRSFFEILSTVETDFFRINFNTNKTPILIKPISPEVDVLYILALAS